jgi:hypothetical protein
LPTRPGTARHFSYACEGRRTELDAGLTLSELAETMRDLGARSALNLDGGGSTALIGRSHLLNRPYEGHDRLLRGCRPLLGIDTTHLKLVDATTFASGIVVRVCTPAAR